MKTSALLFLFSLLTLSGPAQNLEEYVFHESYARTTAAAERNNLTAVGGAVYSCDGPILYLLDETGQQRWNIIPYETGYGWIEDLYWDSDTTIIAAGIDRLADDVGGPADGWVLVRIDTAGNVLTEQRMNFYWGNRIRVRPLEDGRLLASHGSHLFAFDENLDSLFTQTYQLEPFTGELIDFRIFSDTSLILLFYNQVFLTDLEGTITDTLPISGDNLRAIEMTPEAVFAASDDLIQRYDRNTGAVTEIESPPADIRLRSIHYVDGHLYLLSTRQGSQETDLRELSQDGLIDVFPFPTSQRTITRMYPSAEGWLLLGQDYPETQFNPYSLGYLKKLPALDAYSPGPHDVAATDLTYSETSQLWVYDSIPGEYFLGIRVNLQLEVTNQGTTVVDDLVIGSKRQGGFNCAEGRFLENHTELGLAPGESRTFPVSTLDFITHPNPNPATLDLNFCFFATAPNHRLDATPLDNQICQVITSEREPVATGDLRVFPNPATNVLYVQGEGVSEADHIALFDSRGRLVRQVPANGSPAIEIHRGDLPAGLYLLRLEIGKESLTRKILFE